MNKLSLTIDLNDGGNHEEFKLALQRFIRVVVHVQKCRDTNCQFSSCQLLKEIFLHNKHCKLRVKSCRLCERVITSLGYHAAYCEDSKCDVLGCLFMKTQIIKPKTRISSSSASGVRPSTEFVKQIQQQEPSLEPPSQQ